MDFFFLFVFSVQFFILFITVTVRFNQSFFFILFSNSSSACIVPSIQSLYWTSLFSFLSCHIESIGVISRVEDLVHSHQFPCSMVYFTVVLSSLRKVHLQWSNWNKYGEGCPGGIMVKAMDCGIVVQEFVLQSRYYVHFRANTLGKGMNPLILPVMG